MKKLALILVLFISFSALSQEKELDQLEAMLEKADQKTELFYNSSGVKLDIDGYQIPLDHVGYTYLKDDILRIKASKVFPIFDGNTNEYLEEFQIQFASKTDVYEAMELMNRLRAY